VLEPPWTLGTWIVWAMGPGLLLATFLCVKAFPDSRREFSGLAPLLLFGHAASALMTMGMLISHGRFRRVPEMWFLVAYWLPIALGIGSWLSPLRNRGSSSEFLVACFLAAMILAPVFPIVGGVRLALLKRRLARP
jgi:hypothetical protein